jgi:hypothetical protein
MRFPHLKIWLYFAKRSERQGAPVLIYKYWHKRHNSVNDDEHIVRKKHSTLYLSSTKTNNKVCNKCIFSFSATVTDHHTPTTSLSKFTSKKRFGSSWFFMGSSWYHDIKPLHQAELRRSTFFFFQSFAPLFFNNTYASMDSVTEPIWLTFKRRQLHALLDMAVSMLDKWIYKRWYEEYQASFNNLTLNLKCYKYRLTFVTVRSSLKRI